MRIQLSVLIGWACWMLAACQEAPRSEVRAIPRPAEASSAKLRPSPNKALRVSEQMVLTFTTQWINAQNRGDFEAYQQFYGDPFVGIKRAKSKERRFDRKGWLVDRRQLFQQNPHVTASDVHVILTAEGAVVRFQQSWATPRFRDNGPKQLVLRMDGAVLRIGREEMIESRVASAHQNINRYSVKEFAFLQPTVAGLGPVLGRLAQSTSTENLVWLDDNHSQANVTSELGKDLKTFVGMEYDLYSDAWKCRVRIDGLVAIFEGFPLRPMLQDTDAKDVVSSVRRLSDEGFVVGHPKLVAGHCAGALWARAANLPKPVLFSRMPLDPQSVEQALRALGNTSEGRRLQADFDSAPVAGKPPEYAISTAAPRTRASGPWYLEEPIERVAWAYEHPISGERYVSVEVTAGAFCGGGWGAWAFSLFKVSGASFREVVESTTIMDQARALGDHRLVFSPSAAMQLTEGQLPVFTDGALLLEHDGAFWRPARLALGPRFTCHC
ncbi:MAG: nuclear transport factor 2 family protein [Polyangiaceae bacterium]|nr:nuclear transport factor 2 family protein [Polyangiaceae bacterium]